MMVREQAFNKVSEVFERHGAVTIDTPVFELRETNKFGEASKLVYNLEDEGGQLLSLRYDLTVPFARYLASKKITSMRRYHIGKVYRRDKPARGRYREFYQCDFDIAGSEYPAMVPDAEVIKIVTELLDALDVGAYEVKVNHRKLLNLLLASCGVPEDKFKCICSAIDKLDKSPWEKVKTEMVVEKGLPPEVADRIGVQVSKRGNPGDIIAHLRTLFADSTMASSLAEVLNDMETLFSYLEAANCLDRVVFDLSLARGLDYYTGVIFEAVFTGSTQIGSIAAGGRYDNLVSSFEGKGVPVVGLSLGIERVFIILEERQKKEVSKAKKTQVLVLYLEKKLEAVRLASELWAASLSTEFEAIPSSQLRKKLGKAAKFSIPFVVIVGENEEKKNMVRLKEIVSLGDEQTWDEGEEISRAGIADVIKSKLSRRKLKPLL